MSGSKKLSVTDFPVAPRRKKKDDVAMPETSSATANIESNDKPGAGSSQTSRRLRKPSSDVLRAEVQERALSQEDSRNRLKQLSRNRQRQSKHYVNAPLDYQLKKRLERAAHENDLKMTVIIKDALDQYLKDNGY